MTIACLQVFWQLIKRGRNDILLFFFYHLKELGSDGPGGGTPI